MSAGLQEWLSLALVGAAAFYWALRIYRRHVALGLAQKLLRSGKVGLAMKVKKSASSDVGCDGCKD